MAQGKASLISGNTINLAKMTHRYVTPIRTPDQQWKKDNQMDVVPTAPKRGEMMGWKYDGEIPEGLRRTIRASDGRDIHVPDMTKSND